MLVSAQKKVSTGATLYQQNELKKTSHIVRLGAIKPGMMIDKLKDERRLIDQENQLLSSRMGRVTEYVDKRRKRIVEQQEKLERGRSDWQELFRDASVFEFNYAKFDGYRLKDEIDAMQDAIKTGKKDFQSYIRSDPCKGGFAWLTEEQHEDLSTVFMRLRQIKVKQAIRRREMQMNHTLIENYQPRDEGKQAFSAGLMRKMLKQRSTLAKQQTITEIGTPGLAPTSQDSFFNTQQPFMHQEQRAPTHAYDSMQDDGEEDLDRAHYAMTLLLIYKELIETNITISGIPCHVKASYVNGNVCGYVTSALSTKKFEFEFEPMKSLQKKNLIIAEINRLYWDYFPSMGKRKSPNGKSGLVLCRKSEEDCDPYDYNFLDKELYYLAQIQGSRQKYISMRLARQTKDDESSLESQQIESESEPSLTENDEHDYEQSFIQQQSSLYIDCKVFMPNQMLQIEVNLGQYPELKAGLQDVFCIKVSLIDLARKLENDLLIYEYEPRLFRLVFRKNLLPTPPTETPAQLLSSDKSLPDSAATVPDQETFAFSSTPRHPASTPTSSMVKQISQSINEGFKAVVDKLDFSQASVCPAQRASQPFVNGKKTPEILIQQETVMSEEDEAMANYNILYRVRYANPDRFSNNAKEMDDYLSEFIKRQHSQSSRPQSAKSRISAIQRGSGNDKELYDCFKGVLRKNEVQEIQEQEFVPSRMLYSLEDFGSFAPIRMNHKPSKQTTISLIFFRTDNWVDQVKVIFGIESPPESVYPQGEDDSIFTNLIHFEKKLLKEMKTEPIETLDQLMDMVPQFCENLRFRKVIWEEIHAQVPLRRIRANRICRVSTVIAQGENSPRDNHTMIEPMPQTAYQASKATESKSSSTSPLVFDDLEKKNTIKAAAQFRKRLSIDPQKNLCMSTHESAPGLGVSGGGSGSNSGLMNLNLELIQNKHQSQVAGIPETRSPLINSGMLEPLDSGNTHQTPIPVIEEIKEMPATFRN